MIDIAVRDLKKEYEVGQPVLDGLTFQVDTGERVGILGRNGAGKTTLFRILTGQEEADSGEVILSPGKRLGLISQIPVYPAGYTVEDVLRTAFDNLKAMEAELHQISDQLGSGDKDLLARYDRLQAAYEAGGGYEIETRLEKICAGLGIERAFRTKLADLSGEKPGSTWPVDPGGHGDPAAGRAHQPPGPECHGLAGGLHQPL
ncbi:MAG: ATP-binding cassette domain-containing protein [Evtepia gabavorous]